MNNVREETNLLWKRVPNTLCWYFSLKKVPWWLRRSPAVQETKFDLLSWQDTLQKEMATHSSIPSWRTSWTEEPGRFQTMGSQRVGHDWATIRDTVNLQESYKHYFSKVIKIKINSNKSCWYSISLICYDTTSPYLCDLPKTHNSVLKRRIRRCNS